MGGMKLVGFMLLHFGDDVSHQPLVHPLKCHGIKRNEHFLKSALIRIGDKIFPLPELIWKLLMNCNRDRNDRGFFFYHRFDFTRLCGCTTGKRKRTSFSSIQIVKKEFFPILIHSHDFYRAFQHQRNHLDKLAGLHHHFPGFQIHDLSLVKNRLKKLRVCEVR